MKTFTFNDLVFQIFVAGFLLLLVWYLSKSMPLSQLPLNWGLGFHWLREAFQSLVILPLLHFAG